MQGKQQAFYCYRGSVIRILTNSSDSFTNLEFPIYNFFNEYLLSLLWFLFQLANWGKNLFWTNKKFVFFLNCSNWEKFVKQIEKTSDVRSSDELVKILQNNLQLQKVIARCSPHVFNTKIKKMKNEFSRKKRLCRFKIRFSWKHLLKNYSNM